MTSPSDVARSCRAWLFEGRARLLPDEPLPGTAIHGAGGERVRQIELELPERVRDSKWLSPLYEGLASVVEVTTTAGTELAPTGAVVVGRLRSSGNEFRFAIDVSDRNEIDRDVRESVGLYFKMQYSRDGYDDPLVVPGGYPTAGNRIYGCLRRLRELRRQQRFDFDVHARFGLEFRPGLRRRAVSLLQRDERLTTSARLEKRRYYHYLYEVGRSKLCLDLPGNGAFCFRLIDYLAIGSCVIAYPHENLLPEPLTDGHDVVYVDPDLGDLTDVCYYYATHDEERERIAHNAARYFDRHLHRESLARYYVNRCFRAWKGNGEDALGGGARGS